MDQSLNPQSDLAAPARDGSLTVTVRGESLVLLPERAVYWPSQSALLVADLHWGKDETFRQRGSPLPMGVLRSDLDRLAACIKRYPVERVLVLGDLIHTRDGITPAVVCEVAAWRSTNPVDIALVPGNHDRHVARLPAEFGIEVMDRSLVLGALKLTHDPTTEGDGPGYPIGGHVHPHFRIRSRNDQIRLPCFYFGPHHALLPAFSEFAGSYLVEAEKGAEVFVTDGRVVLSAPSR